MHYTDTEIEDGLKRRICNDLLGPVVHRWLLGLEQHLAFFEDEDTRFLFCARAGVRIKELYKLHLSGRGRVLPENAQMFWISRLALCKGLYKRDPDMSATIIAREYANQPLRHVVQGLFRSAPEMLAGLDLTTRDLDAHGHNFAGWLGLRSKLSSAVVEYLNASSAAFDAELENLLDGASRAVLIDSGWQGTSQSLLHHGYREVDWYGLYIGRILTADHDHAITDRVIGLLFQAETFNPASPETAIAVHRHLFETLLEPEAPSIEEIRGGPCDRVAQAQISANKTAAVSELRDPLYILVRKYLEENAKLGPAEILARHQAAMPELARVLVQPTREEAMALFCKKRSADFGKKLDVPVLVYGAEDVNFPSQQDNRDVRIQHALWPAGQIALEYNGKLRDELQLRSAGLASDQSYFDVAEECGLDVEAASITAAPEQPLVAIITRTKNRPVLLRRAAESVASQSYGSYLWVVVNDGGDEDIVRDVIAGCSVDRRKIRLVSNRRSLGMEAASNAGIRHVESDYVLIHDDDDSLHPDFLLKTVTYLESSAGGRYGGAITRTEYVSEEIRGDEVIEHGRHPYMEWVANIQLSELMAQNTFAPIAFLYRRQIYDEIGGYNPELPVLGDWFFNLEFVLRADIKVLGETLAYYHHRDRSDGSQPGIYSNSVIGGQNKHEEFASVFRNMFLRKYSNNNAVAAGMIGAYFATDFRAKAAAPVPAVAQNVVELPRSYDEEDRLWLLSRVLEWQGTRSGLIMGRRAKTMAFDASFDELSEFVWHNEIQLSIPKSFNNALYIQKNPDVEAAVKDGVFQTGYHHYVIAGRKEQRPRPSK